MIGFNGRLDTLQAAILLAKFDIFPHEVARRWEIGNCYSAMIKERCPDMVTPYIEKRIDRSMRSTPFRWIKEKPYRRR